MGAFLGIIFLSKIDEQIDTEINPENTLKIKEETMRKWTYILMIFGIASHDLFF